jgi:signal transduction histidine kinase
VLGHVNAKLAEFSAAEPFSAVAWVDDVDRTARPDAAGVGLQEFPFFEVIFEDSGPAGISGLRQQAFPYSMSLLVLVTVLGSVFVYRAMSHEARLARLRNDFVAAVSHEFRSPLSSILALVERLEASRIHDPEKLSQYHQLIGKDARRLSTLVTRLLDFAQIEEGKTVYSLERIDLVAAAREAIESCGHAARPDRISLLGAEAAPLWVRADRTALHHSIQNVIENAMKYSPPEAPIGVRCGSVNGFHVVEVVDRGVGIPSAERGRIFEKFYRGRQASELNVQGVGIGLALVKHVIESHGGSITVNSEPGEGSRFSLRLPRA